MTRGFEKIVICSCGSSEPSRWLYDGYGCELCRACSKCEDEKLSHFRSDISRRYECDETIEDDY